MASLYLLLLLPTLAFAAIEVQVSGKFALDSQDLKVKFSGSETNVISDAEINTFQLSGENVKRGVQNYYGKRPDYVNFKGPFGDLGDLYTENNWSQVMRFIKPLRGKILNITSKPEVMIRQIFENSRWEPALFNVAFSETVTNTIKTSWSISKRFSIKNDIKYKFDFLVGDINRRTTLTYTMAYGKDQNKSTPTTLGATTPIELLLRPGKSMMAELIAIRRNVILEMEYEASLSGRIIVYYNNKYGGHNIWSMGINPVMGNAGLKKTFVNKQIVELEFYSVSKVAIRDKPNEDLTTTDKPIE